MLWDREAVRANIRNREGKRVFFLREGDRLTFDARDFLRREGVELRPGEEAKIDTYRLLSGGTLEEKPEHMTHLRGDILVPKTHPRIVFRGAMDELQGALLLCQPEAGEKLRKDLGELLALARSLVRWEVLEEPVPEGKLCGLTEAEQRERSHRPQDFYGQPHFVPSAEDGIVMLRLNLCRCAARRAELAGIAAFLDRDGNLTREDIPRALNRMSSMLWILMIQEKQKGNGGRPK